MSQSDVDAVYANYPKPQKAALAHLRAMILDVAATTDGVGEIEEALKWGQPGFMTARPKSGSLIRIDAVRDSQTKYAIYFICTTKLVARFREQYPDEFNYSGNRAMTFDIAEPLPEEPLRHCIAMALTYKL